jgi:hypothetical protein
VVVLELDYECSAAVIDGWVQFLGRLRADTFSTITFDDHKSGFARSGQNAVDRASWVVRAVSKSIHRPLPSFIVAESHRFGGIFHVHGIHRVSSLSSEFDWLVRTALWRTAFSRYGRCEFRSIKDVGGVRGYVSKYIVKRAADWQILFGDDWDVE